MSEGSSKKEITLEAGLEAVVHYGDTTIELRPGGDLDVTTSGKAAVHAKGDVEVYTNAAVHVHPAANDRVPAKLEPKPGDRRADGTICAGISPDTGKPMFTTPADAPVTYTFNEAADYAKQLNVEKYLGYDDWRVPTKGELNVLWENCDKGALKGTFNVTGSFPAGWYCSSTETDYDSAWGQRFSDGNQCWYYEDDDSSLRCVR